LEPATRWFGSVGSTATAISLSGFQSWLYSVVLQLMSTAVAGLPALEQRNRSICSLENCPPGSLLPTPVPASFSSGAGPHLRATRSAAPNGRSLPDDGTLDASTSNAAPSTATTTRLIPVLRRRPRRRGPPVPTVAAGVAFQEEAAGRSGM